MRFILTLLFLTFSSAAIAAETAPDAHAIAQKAAELRLPFLEIDEIRKTPIAGLYEVRSGRNLYYSDAKGDYFVFGADIVDTNAKKSLTRERKEQINSIDWNLLPLEKAVVSGDKNAKLKLAVFTDPDCPYCRKLEKELTQLKGVTVYTFLFPLEQLHPNARAKSTAIWCAKDQHEMLKKVMLEKYIPEAAVCETPIDDIQKLAMELNINGTPALIAGDGRIASGGKSAADLKAWLEKR